MFSHFLKSKFNPSQHGFMKCKFTVTNFIAFLGFGTPLVCSQGQIGSIYFDFSKAFNFLRHAAASQTQELWIIFRLLKLVSQLFNRQSRVRLSGTHSVPIVLAVRYTAREVQDVYFVIFL
jgi:hypothetical protein